MKTWKRLTLILIVVAAALFGLSFLAHYLRVQDPAQAKNWITADYNTAKTWATDILGFATTLGGFLGVLAAVKSISGLDELDRAHIREGGMVGVLAGATLLGVGGLLAPLGLAAMATGVGTANVVRAVQRRD